MDSLTTWEYNGQSFFLDLQDVETAERYEAGLFHAPHRWLVEEE